MEASERSERARSARRSRIISETYTQWIDERRRLGTLESAFVGELSGEEGGELASLAAEAEAELHRRTTEALRAAGL